MFFINLYELSTSEKYFFYNFWKVVLLDYKCFYRFYTFYFYRVRLERVFCSCKVVSFNFL